MHNKPTHSSQRRALFHYYLSKIRKVGFRWTFYWLLRRAIEELGWLIFLPATLILHGLGYRRVPINISNLGHLASETDAFLKQKILGHLPDKRWFLLAPPGKAANPCLLDYWRPHIRIIQTPWQCFLLSAMSRHHLMSINIANYVYAFQGTAKYYAIQSEWADRPPLLRITPEDRIRGQKILQQMGVPADAWFVTIHVREAGFSAAEETAHAHRNSSLDRLNAAIREIRRRGGWVIRMGDPSTQTLPPGDGVIDYAHHSLRSDWMDVFLCAECRFFLGNSSGLFILSTVFGVPCALANMVPTSHAPFTFRDVYIPKLIWSNERKRFLTFKEIFSSPIANFRLAQLFNDLSLSVEENSSEDILDLVSELFDKNENRWQANAQDTALQMQYKSLLKPGDYGFGAQSHIGSAFLKKHHFLFEDNTSVDIANSHTINTTTRQLRQA